jgi:hypothetical protein
MQYYPATGLVFVIINGLLYYDSHNNTFHITLIKLFSHTFYQNNYRGINLGFHYIFFIIKLNKIVLQILLQDKYTISVLTLNREFMWLGRKRMERPFKASFPPFLSLDT